MFGNAFLFLLFFSNSYFTFVSAQSEKELLLELRNNLTYDLSVSSKLVHWDESVDFCRWPGVDCDDKGLVSGLDLSGESIYDGINSTDSSLFRLTNLQSLNLAQNSLNSIEFPLGFGQLTELRYLNLSSSGFYGQIPSDLSNLTRLVSLDLSDFTSSLNLPNLQRLIQTFTGLRELHLNGVNISANGNEWGSAISSSLPNLRVLSMSTSSLTGPFDPSLQKLRSLSDIRLDGNNFSSPFPEFFADFRNLKVLILTSCGLSGFVPAKLFQIKSMQTILLGGNDDLGGTFPEFPVNGSLQELVLGGPNFSGTLPESIGSLRMLSEFRVVGCNISGPIPSFSLLKNLTRIDLSGNRLTGQIPDSWNGLDNLVSLNLRRNSLEGKIPPSIFLLPNLGELLLSDNSFSGTIEASSTNILSEMQTLDLSFNKLEGRIPSFLFQLRHLSTLDLSSNKFSGPLEITDLLKLTSLINVDISYNNLSVHVNEEASFSSSLPHLVTLKLASCKLQKLPNVANHSVLAMLDLSQNELEGGIPNWMWGGNLRFLNLSNNGFTHFQEPYNLRRLDYLNLHSNMFVGQIPSPLTSAVVLDFSNNSFSSISPDIGNSLLRTMFFSAADNQITGAIPSSFCNASSLEVFDLSNNGFHGEIPSCLLGSTLKVLNLRRNNLDGDVPDAFPVDCSLETLDLSRNFLREKLPKSLTRCSNLELLDLTKNELKDTFPCWLKTLSKLRVLVLRSNMLHGSISCLGEENSWQDLQIMDFASNNISGSIPSKMFEKLHAFSDGEEQELDHLHFSMQTVLGLYYQDSVTVSMKGQSYNLSKIQTIFTSIDFSDNHLEGAIPETVGELKSLYLLNFSHNSLSGHIPSSMEGVAKLQSLDLSFNGLDGEIPSQLASGLTFLAVLNLSYNHLVGRIPVGSQFQTFSESSFLGNDGLCGFPMNRNCSDEGETAGEVEREEEISEREIYVSAALGFAVGIGFIVLPVVFCKRWRSYYSKCLTRIVVLVLGRQN